jgi:hypothetical protein
MTAESVARALGGHKAGSAWMARCRAHEDRHPSLSITNAGVGKVLVRCHAGCDQHRVIAALRARGIWSDAGHIKTIATVVYSATASAPSLTVCITFSPAPAGSRRIGDAV